MNDYILTVTANDIKHNTECIFPIWVKDFKDCAEINAKVHAFENIYGLDFDCWEYSTNMYEHSNKIAA